VTGAFFFGMFTVYVLFSPKFRKIYVGFTANLEQRMIAHNQLAKKGFTVKFRPWEILFTEQFESKTDAMRREKALKTAAGRAFIWSIINNP